MGLLRGAMRQLGRGWNGVCRGDLEKTVRELMEGQAQSRGGEQGRAGRGAHDVQGRKNRRDGVIQSGCGSKQRYQGTARGDRGRREGERG